MNLEERFMSKVSPEPNTGCWLWTGADCRGYGRIRIDGKSEIASRVAWRLFVGPIPEGLFVLHHCDIHECVNYERCLFVGTAKDNTDDMMAKGRHQPRNLIHHPIGSVETKTCTDCGVVKLVSDFYVRAGRLSRPPTPACKQCHRGYAAAARLKFREN